MAMQFDKIPTTVITGFLGSGKTTLVRHILQNNEGRRIAIIVNEFGEMGVDGDIIEQCAIGCEDEKAGENVIELPNGCLCCTVQEEFFPVMKELVDRRDQIDHILIETSGLALPKPLVEAFNWPEIKSSCTVDAVITVVDGPAAAEGLFAAHPEKVDEMRKMDENLDHESPLHELFEDQLAAADLVLLNKTDQMDHQQKSTVHELLDKELPQSVKVIETRFGHAELDVLLGQQAASEDHIHKVIDHHSQHHGEDGESDHDHDDFDSVNIDLADIELDKLMVVLSGLVNEHEIYRIKGFLNIPGKPMRCVLQGVGRRFDHYFDRLWQADETRCSKLVFIGHDLDEAALKSALDSLLQQAA